MSRKNIIILFSVLILIFTFFFFYVMDKSIFSGFKFGGPSEELKDFSQDPKYTTKQAQTIRELENFKPIPSQSVSGVEIKPRTPEEIVKELNSFKPTKKTSLSASQLKALNDFHP